MTFSWKSLIVLLSVSIILAVPGSVISINQSFIGVVKGDIFTYGVDKYSSSNKYDLGYHLGYEDDTNQRFYAIKGDKFTITIESIIVNRQYNSEIERIDYEVNYENIIFTESVYFDQNFGRIMTSTDWETQKRILNGRWNIQGAHDQFLI